MDKHIENQLRLCPTLPTLSTIAVRLIDVGQNPDIDLREVSKLLSQDPALAAKTLRVANSPLYMRGRLARNLNQAVNVLGLNATVSVALSFSLGACLHAPPEGGVNLEYYWRRALLSAQAARLLGIRQGIHISEELFLAGLLQDIGMLVLNAAMPEAYAGLRDVFTHHEQLVERERKELGIDHFEAGAWLMEEWGLPHYLVLAIRASHDPGAIDIPPDLEAFVGSVATSGRVAEIYLAKDTEAATAQAVRVAHDSLNMSPSALGEVLGRMANALPEIEALFETAVLSPSQAIGITDQARELLITRNLQLLRSATELQARENEFRKQAIRLDEMARRDALTGIYNRRHFDEAFAKQFAEAVMDGNQLSLAYLDLDNFKTINDQYGHPVGDEILKRVAAEVQTLVRQNDLFARYGGEEFVLLLPAIGPEPAAQILTRIRAAVEALAHPLASGQMLGITLSAGVASYTGGPRKYENPRALMQAADRALYQAKQNGRNCVVSAT